jgi:Zn-finger nucleic acid-binding protein
MSAKTLNCPTCGASMASDEPSCRYCGSRLAIIACPSCFGTMFVGSKFCPHCGALAEKPLEVGPALDCPNCHSRMKQILLKATPLQECERCLGIWVDQASFDRISADRERQADVLSSVVPPPRIVPAPVRYRPCPQCGQLMNRLNYARTSGVIVDICAGHGFWFDRDELRRVIDFLQAGGMDLSRQDEWDERTKNMRELEAQRRVDQIGESFARENPSAFVEVCRALGRAIGRL